MDIVYAETAEEALYYMARGCEPIECSFGKDSVVSSHILDHHGPFSKEPPVAVKAVQWVKKGLRLNNFVVTGEPDTDAAFAIAVLSDHIPANEEEAWAVAELDTNPIVYDQTLPRYRKALLHRRAMLSLPHSEEGFRRSVAEAIRIFNGQYKPDEEATAIKEEWNRRKYAGEAVRMISKDRKVLFATFNDWGQDVWFRKAPVVVNFNDAKGTITLYCDTKSPRNPLGSNGLKSLYPLLGDGWGGRENIGGSPRDRVMTYANARQTFVAIKELLRKPVAAV
ncbi:MAG: hypothetical protein WC520_00465 [Candidatus Paceibacterota bacterium]